MDSQSSPRVRIVAKVKASANPEPGSVKRTPGPWISVNINEHNPSSRVRISFRDQPARGKQQSYVVDECYGGDAGNDVLFEKEIRPLFSGVFEGRSATVFAYGAKSSGKTFTIQGTEGAPGVAAMAVGEIMTRAGEMGHSVSISLFEVHQERVIDLLDSKRPEVSVFEDARGKIKLKGLSKVNVKSVPEFMELYFPCTSAPKPLQKVANKPFQHRHRGLIIHVLSSPDAISTKLVVGKMNFVDLAGYEDPRKKGINGTNSLEISRSNKSLHSIQKVIHALNAGESSVPFRESKLTHILQASLGGRMNQILMVACLNPSFCEDTVKALSLASRSCLASHLAIANAAIAKREKSAAKPVKLLTSSVSTKKQATSMLHISKDKSCDLATEEKGRRLLTEDKQQENTEKCLSTAECSLQEEENSVLDVLTDDQPSQIMEYSSPAAISEAQLFLLVQAQEADIPDVEDDHVMPTPVSHHTPKAADLPFKDQENKSLLLDKGGSPLLSARLQELSNNLKSLYTSTKLKLPATREDESVDHDEAFHEISLFRTPSSQIDVASPQEKFHSCNCRMKDSFVQAHLNFMNTANREELMRLKGIGEKRASSILELRCKSPRPFKNLTDLETIGLSSKQIKLMMKEVAGNLF